MRRKDTLAKQVAELAKDHPAVIKHLLNQADVVDSLASNTRLVYELIRRNAKTKPLVRDSSEDTRVPSSALQWFETKAFLNSATSEALLEELSRRVHTRSLSARDVLGLLSAEEIADNVSAEALVREGSILRKLLQSGHCREQLRLLHARETMTRLSYPYPAVVCSFPRSGSNFLQNVLTQSSGLENISIYARRDPDAPIGCTLTVKSHALSPTYLFEEYARKLSTPPRPDRVILLQRDPRDVMISFFDYTEFNRGVKLDQRTFLESTDFFYAGTIDRNSERKRYTAPLSVRDAYREHIRRWFRKPPKQLKRLIIRFEDLVRRPGPTFRRIFKFLELDCPLADGFLDIKVSQYGEMRRQRGVASGWRELQDDYGALIDSVLEHLRAEIELLGYAKKPAKGKARQAQPSGRKTPRPRGGRR